MEGDEGPGEDARGSVTRTGQCPENPDRYRSFLAGFSRVTSGRDVIPEIDGLRFIAIAGVIAHHVVLYASESYVGVPGSAEVTRWAHAGAFGVQLFFVISGMVLGLPFARQYIQRGPPVRVGAYFKRRLTRLEPPYLVSLVTIYLVKVGGNLSRARALAPNLVASMGYVHDFVYNHDSYISGVAWSLEVEFQFYLLAPLLALVYRLPSVSSRRLTLIAMAVGLVAFVSWNPGGFVDRFHLGRSILVNGQYFFAGMLLADWYIAWRDPGPEHGHRGFDIVCLLAFLVIFVSIDQWPREYAVAEVLRAGLIVLCYWAVFHARATRSFFRIPTIVVIGGMCYSIYLTHNAVIYLVAHVLVGMPHPTLQWIGLAVLGPLASLVVGAGFFRMVERPTMQRDWPQRLRRLLFAPRKLAGA